MLKRKSSLRNRLTKLAHDAFDGHLLWLPQAVTRRFQGAATVVHSIDAIDLERSRAFVPGTDGVLVVRSPEDEPAIIAGLSSLKDESGREVCRVYRRDQIYHGPKVGEAPELLLVPRDDINIRTDPFRNEVLSRSGDFPKGNHSSNGIFFAQGPDIIKSPAGDVTIEDVAPTALALLGVKPGESMDGRILDGIVCPVPLRPVELDLLDGAEPHAYSEKEEKQVMENLRRLGYT